MLDPSDKEKERIRDYLLFASYHPFSTDYMSGIILSISLMFFTLVLSQSFEGGFIPSMRTRTLSKVENV